MWSQRTVLGETLRSIRAEAWRGFLVVMVAAGATGLTVGLELTAAHDAVATSRAMTLAGRNAFAAVNVAPGGTITTARCMALNGNPAVIAAGTLTDGGRVGLTKAPGEYFSARYVLGPAPRVLTGRDEGPLGAAAGIGTAAAKRIGVTNGSPLSLDSARGTLPTRVLAVEHRTPDPGAWLYLPANPAQSEAGQCVVEVRPGARTSAVSLITSALSDAETAVQVSPTLAPDRFQRDPLLTFNERPTRWAWAAAALVLTLMVAGLVWFRRAEIALLRTLGPSWPQPVTIYAGQHTALAWLGSILGTLWATCALGLRYHLLTGEMLASAFRSGAMVMLATAIGATVVTALVCSGRVANQIKDRL